MCECVCVVVVAAAAAAAAVVVVVVVVVVCTYMDHLCGLVVRGLGLIPSATRFSEK
jgi:hypothetical protein